MFGNAEGQDSFIELFERICKSQTCFLTSVHWLMHLSCSNLRPSQRTWFWEGMNTVKNWFALWLVFRAEMIHDDKYWINDKNRLIQSYTWRQAQILLFLIFCSGIFRAFLIHEAKVMNLRWELLTHQSLNFSDGMPFLHSFLRYFWVLQCCWDSWWIHFDWESTGCFFCRYPLDPSL